MPRWRERFPRLSARLQRRAERREIEQELRSHLELRIQDNLNDGMSATEARDEAYRRFGNYLQIQHTCLEIKEANSEAIVRAFLNDLRYGARILLKKPGFAVVAIITLALGIGVNSAIFSIVNTILLRPLPYREPDRIVQFWETNPTKGWNDDTVTCAPANFLDWQKQSQSFEGMAGYIGHGPRGAGFGDYYLTGGDQPERLQGLKVTGNLFSVLGVPAAIGRTFEPEETWEGHDHVVILSYHLWERRFASDPSIVGKTILLDGTNITVVGVMPRGFYFPTKKAELWSPMGWNQNRIAQLRRPHYLRVIARLKPGMTVARARSEMSAIAGRLEEQYPITNKDMGVGLAIMRDWDVADTRLGLYVFLGAVAFVLLIACANVANLLLARSATRTREFALRAALGAGRERLIRQLLTESLLLSTLGGMAGLLLATVCNRLVIAFSPGGIPRLDEVSLDGRVLVFTFGVTFLTAIIFGLMPAISGSRLDLNEALKEGGGQKGGYGGSGARLRGALVVAEIALSLILVIGAGLMMKSFLRLQQVNPGFDPANLLTMVTSLPDSSYKDEDRIRAFYQQTLERIQSLPGVQSATAVFALAPTGPASTSDFTIEGRPPAEYGKEVRHNTIMPTYFQTMKVPLMSGRNFTEADTAKSLPVTIISETLARRYFYQQNPIGQHIKFSKPEIQGDWYTIVGVVKDVKQEGLALEAPLEIYQPFAQDTNGHMNLVIRTSGDPHNFISPVLATIKAIDKDLPPYDIRTMDEVMSASVGKERFTMSLIAGFAGVALLLAAVGIYGVMSYTISRRTGEIGIRMALGAQQRNILLMVLGQGLRLIVMGLMVGMGGALVLTRVITTLLFNVSASDPLVFVSISALLTIVAILACLIPARRATRINPITALHCE